MTNIPSNTQTATNSKASLLVGEDTANAVFRNLAVLPTGAIVTSVGAPSGGGSSTGTFSTIDVDDTLTGTVLLAANAARIQGTVVNNGAEDMWLGLGSMVAGNAAAATGGVLLSSGGGSWSSDGYAGEVRGFALTGAATVAGVQEW